MAQKGVSRFFGVTSREAMRQVRLALGPEALIISNRRVNGGVEIIAADPSEVVEQQSSSQDNSSSSAQQFSLSGQLEQQLSSLRRELSGQMDALLWGDTLRAHVPTFVVYQRLLALGFSAALARRLLMQLPRDLDETQAWQWVIKTLEERLPVQKTLEHLLAAGSTIALVGPTGVGKTTTLAKLAYQCVQMHGAERVALISTDNYRVGAHEQLKIYAQLLKVPINVVQNATEFRQALLSYGPDTLVLIDSVGVSQRDELVQAQANLLYGSGRAVQRLLVLSAASSGETLDEVARAYKTDGGRPLQGCVVTKLDEASTVGGIIDVAIRYQLPIAFATNGQRVPEDIVLPDEGMIWRCFLNEQFQSVVAAAQFKPSVADMAALARHSTVDELASVEIMSDPQERARQESLLQLLQPWGTTASQRLDLASVQQMLLALKEDMQWQFWSEQQNAVSHSKGTTFEQSAQTFLQALWAQAVRRLGEHDTVFFFHDHLRAPQVWHADARLQISHAWTAAAGWQGPFFVQQFSTKQHLHFPAFRRKLGPEQVKDLYVAAAHALPQASQLRSHVHLFSDYTYTRFVRWLEEGFQLACIVPAATTCYDGQANTTVGAAMRQANLQPLYMDAETNRVLVQFYKGESIKVNYATREVLLGRTPKERHKVRLLILQILSAHDDRELETVHAFIGGIAEPINRSLLQALLVFFIQRPIKGYFQHMLSHKIQVETEHMTSFAPQELYLQALAGICAWRLVHDPKFEQARKVLLQLWGERSLQAVHLPHTLERLVMLQRVLSS